MCQKYIAYRNELLLFLVTNMFWSLHCPAFYFRAQCVPHWGKRTGVVEGGHERPLPNKGLTSLLLPRAPKTLVKPLDLTGVGLYRCLVSITRPSNLY